ncbi:MAG: hypothetical protein ACYC6C_11600, partial [Coriobacteriia bacterium]
ELLPAVQIARRQPLIRSQRYFTALNSTRELLQEVVDLAEFLPLGPVHLPVGHVSPLQSTVLA